MGSPANGWQSGRDPVLLRLRAVTVLVFLGTFVYLVVAGRPITESLPLVAIDVAALMILLGYERVARLPGFGKRDDE